LIKRMAYPTRRSGGGNGDGFRCRVDLPSRGGEGIPKSVVTDGPVVHPHELAALLAGPELVRVG
jgi:hypothetical protein